MYVTKTFTFEGKRYYVRGKTEYEAIEKMITKKQSLMAGKIIESSMPLSVWAEECIKTYKTNQSEITQKKYVNRMNHCVIEHIGDMPINKIKAIHCQKVLNIQQGNSQRQINEVHQIMNFLFSKAVDNKLITENPAANLVKPSGYTHEKRSLTEEEKEYIVPLLENERFKVFALMYYCGLRPSEARECLYEDLIDKEVLLLHVRGTKTQKADRIIPVPDELKEIIGTGTGYIGKSTTGSKHTPTSFRKAWLQLLKQTNIAMGCKTYKGRLIETKLADDLTPYILRHTFASELVEKGIDIRISAYMLGHSSITVTNDIYTHVSVEQVISATVSATPNVNKM